MLKYADNLTKKKSQYLKDFYILLFLFHIIIKHIFIQILGFWINCIIVNLYFQN